MCTLYVDLCTHYSLLTAKSLDSVHHHTVGILPISPSLHILLLKCQLLVSTRPWHKEDDKPVYR